jgi:hypothetical protein
MRSSSENNVRMIKPSRLGLVGHVERMGEVRNVYIFRSENERKTPLGIPKRR